MNNIVMLAVMCNTSRRATYVNVTNNYKIPLIMRTRASVTSRNARSFDDLQCISHTLQRLFWNDLDRSERSRKLQL